MIDRVRYWDLAASDESGCFTAGVRMSKKVGVYYVAHVIRGQWTPHRRDDILLQTAQLDENDFGTAGISIYIEQEPGSAGVSVTDGLIRMLSKYPVYADRPTGSKDVRLEPFAAQLEAGNVRIVKGAWNRDYIEELVAIPNGQFRDQADATAGAFNMLSAATTGEIRFGKFKW